MQRITAPGVEELTSRSPTRIGPFSVVALTGTRPIKARSGRSSAIAPSGPLARVIAGMEVVDQLQRGDVIRVMRVWDGTTPF